MWTLLRTSNQCIYTAALTSWMNATHSAQTDGLVKQLGQSAYSLHFYTRLPRIAGQQKLHVRNYTVYLPCTSVVPCTAGVSANCCLLRPFVDHNNNRLCFVLCTRLAEKSLNAARIERHCSISQKGRQYSIFCNLSTKQICTTEWLTDPILMLVQGHSRSN